MKKRSKKFNKLTHVFPLFVIGAGLIVLGLVSAKLISAEGPEAEYSVVPVSVNFPAPELILDNLEGNRVAVSDFRQNIVLINNWATWCPPCKAEMPTLSEYYDDYRDQGFVLLAIDAGDPQEEVAQFVKDYRLSFPVLLDPNNRSLIAFGNDSLPSSYVIDRDGNVVYAWTGPINRAILDKYITPLLEQ